MAAIPGDDVITEGESEVLDRLDDVRKRMFSVRVLGRVGPGAEEHCQCLKRQISCMPWFRVAGRSETPPR